MIEIKIKPLSVNQAWQGRRYKTTKYTKYERDLLLMLPKLNDLEPPFAIDVTFFFSNVLSDIDNPLKPMLDVIQKKYSINDRDVYELNVKKVVVKKCCDKIEFKIRSKIY